MMVSNYTTGIPGRKVACIVLSLLMTGSVQAQSQSSKGGVHIGLIYPISTHGTNAAASTNNFSFQLLAGVSKNETGAAFSGFSNVIFGNASGAQFAGFSNHIGGQSSGAQLAGFMNFTGDARGTQLAGFMNASKNSTGIQLAGFANYSKGSGGKFQAAGYLNIAKDVKLQLSGFMNIGQDVHTQLGSFLNIARKVKGVQVGFINIAESGTPVGLVNIVKDGEMAVRVTVDELGTVIGGFRSGGKRMYGVLGIGYNGKTSKTMYALEAAIGAHFPVSEYFRMNTELASANLDDFKKGEFFRGSLRVFPSFKIGNQLEIFAGPTFNYVYFDIASGKGVDLVNHFMWSGKAGDEHQQGMYIGAIAGISWKLM
ncbi:hypothetical protein [Pseudoflavitalea rhizosphaerae]|uniref:hypothetical protein n=1 Tax=Pseudoflavitalea rhizosphaerae TaxID=1884793 RepID=UPI000F8D2D2C|nr:hypothetical protein [Pseudoflavitalea rhizosphaerae]